MNNKPAIDVSSVLEHLEQEIKQGIRDGGYTVTDISLAIGDAVSEFKNKVMADVAKIIDEEETGRSDDLCADCGNTVKKTIKQIKP